MTIQKRKKLNQLMHILPAGVLVDRSWLAEHGYSASLVRHYTNAGWLESPARGIFRLPRSYVPEREPWEPIVISLQFFGGKPFVLGGRSALEFQGYGHYVSKEGLSRIHLYGDHTPPAWSKRMPDGPGFVFHKNNLFNSSMKLDALKKSITSNDIRQVPVDILRSEGLRVTFWGQDNLPLICSSPERAILELLNDVPTDVGFDLVDKMFEGLRTLNPKVLNGLLGLCARVKVKRLFMWFAGRHDFRWRPKLDTVDLGRGKRSLVSDGKLDPKYLITVPKNMVSDDL